MKSADGIKRFLLQETVPKKLLQHCCITTDIRLCIPALLLVVVSSFDSGEDRAVESVGYFLWASGTETAGGGRRRYVLPCLSYFGGFLLVVKPWH